MYKLLVMLAALSTTAACDVKTSTISESEDDISLYQDREFCEKNPTSPICEND